MAAPVTQEKVVYLLDPPAPAAARPCCGLADRLIRALGLHRNQGVELPYTPAFLHKHGGLVMSLGQFMQFRRLGIDGFGTVQIWPGTPVERALVEMALSAACFERPGRRSGRHSGSRLHARYGCPRLSYRCGDGPVEPSGASSTINSGCRGHHQREWAVGMKMVVDLPSDSPLEPGTVFHTFGYPEPEIFGFFYVHPEHVATVGIFVPSWFRSPMRSSYRYLQHFMLHPYLWRYLQGAKLRSWGAKSLQESGRRGERSWPEMATRASAKVREAPTCSPAPAWTKPGPLDRSSPRPSSSCSAKAARSPKTTWNRPTWRAAARVGSSRKDKSPRKLAMASTAA